MTDLCGYLCEVETACGSVEIRDTKEKDAGRERREEDKLGSGFCRLFAMFTECHQCGQGDGSGFQPDKKQKEVAAGDHEVHSQQGAQCEEIVFTPLILHLLPVEHIFRLQKNDQRGHIQHGLNNCHYGMILIHAAERFTRCPRNKVQEGVQGKEEDCHRLKIFFSFLAGNDIEEQQKENDGQ